MAPDFELVDAAEEDLKALCRLAGLSGLARWTAKDYRKQTDSVSADLRLLRIHSMDPRSFTGFYLAQYVNPGAELLQFVICREQRRKGWGSVLLQDLLARTGERRCSSCDLEVRSANQGAIRFYQHHGFETVSVRRKYYRDPEDDALLMRRLIA